MQMKKFKRPLEGEPGSGPSDRVPKRRLARSSSFLRNASFSHEDLVNKLMEPMVRRVFREEFDRIRPIFLGPSSRFFNNPIHQSNGESHLTLQFITNPPETVFTKNTIQAAGNSPVFIELTDSRTGSRVTNRPLSSLKIEIVALEGDFDPDNPNFNQKIVQQREGRGPILNGDLTVTLTEGLGCLKNVVFTDNSSWIPCGKFRLGARVSPKSRVGEPVREASSGEFKVKDHRGIDYEKRHPPYPNDNVWRLEKIAKDGKYCGRLASVEIETVKDFLRFQEIYPLQLKKILGGKGTGISDRTWETIVRHTGECIIDENEMFTYSSPEFPNLEILFDQVYRVKGVTFNGCKYYPVEKLNDSNRILMQNLKRHAYENLNQLIPVKGPLALGPPRDLTSSATDRFLVQQDISASTSASSYKVPGSHFSEVSGPTINYTEDAIVPPTVTENFTSVDNTWSQRLHGANNFGPSTSSADQNGPQCYVSANFPANLSWTDDDISALFVNELEPGNLTSFARNFSFCIEASNEAGPSFNVHIHGTARTRVAWCKIRAAFKWTSVRRNLAARRNLVTATRQQVFCQ